MPISNNVHPQTITQILNEILDVVHLAHIATLLFDLFDTTQRAQGGVAGFRGRHPFSGVFLNQLLEVEA
jgi:hypothetical protein